MAKNVSLAAILLGLCASVSWVQAQDAILSELYGRGVHAYYSGKLEEAHSFLSQAIEKGTQDPRCFIFRGLTYARSGRPEEAEADIKKGAEIEAADSDRHYDVSRSLQRVQGEIRMLVEKHRDEARIGARELAAKRARTKYDEFLNDEKRVLLAPTGTAPPSIPESAATKDVNDPFGAAPAPPAPPAANPSAPVPLPTEPAAPDAAAPAPAGTDPAGATPNAAAAAAPTTPPTTPAADPFATPKAPATTTPKPATDDPFATPPAGNTPAPADGAAPASPPPGATPPANSAPTATGGGSRKGAIGGLFRALKGAVPKPNLPNGIPGVPGAGPGRAPGGDPFGANPGSPPGGNDPFGAPPKSGGAAPPAGNDPFGAPPAGTKPDGAKPDGAKPSDNDPFGDPAKPSAPKNDDPFKKS